MGISPEALARAGSGQYAVSVLAAGIPGAVPEAGPQPRDRPRCRQPRHLSARDLPPGGQDFSQAGRRCTLHGPFQDLSPGALDDLILAATRRRLRQAWRWLPVFRPAAVVCHLGYEDRHFSWDQENWLDRAAATYRELGTQAAGHGVRVMLENVYERDPGLIREAIRRIDLANVRVCLDVGHLNAFGGGDFQGWLETLWPIIGHLHLHDNLGTLDDHQALGTGNIPLQFVLTFLAARGVRPLITLEPHQEGSLTPSLEYLAQIWPWAGVAG